MGHNLSSKIHRNSHFFFGQVVVKYRLFCLRFFLLNWKDPVLVLQKKSTHFHILVKIPRPSCCWYFLPKLLLDIFCTSCCWKFFAQVVVGNFLHNLLLVIFWQSFCWIFLTHVVVEYCLTKWLLDIFDQVVVETSCFHFKNFVYKQSEIIQTWLTYKKKAMNV